MQGSALLLQSELIGQCNYVERIKRENPPLPYLDHPEGTPLYMSAEKYSYLGLVVAVVVLVGKYVLKCIGFPKTNR